MVARITPLLLVVAWGFSVLAGSATPTEAEGIGIFPSNIDYVNVLRGGEYYQDIGVVNDSSVERSFRFETGGEVAGWLGFFDIKDRSKAIDELPVPANSSGHVYLRLQVPRDLANGKYSGYIRVLIAVKSNTEGSSLTVNLGAQANVGLTVTGSQNLSGSLLDVAVTDTEVGVPLRIRTVVLNSGNVGIQPEVSVDLKPVNAQPGNSATVPTSASVIAPTRFVANEQVFPGETKTVVTEVATDNVPPGPYTAQIGLRFGTIALGSKDVRLTVQPRGTLTRRGELLELKLVNQPQPGGLAKVTASVVNTGQIDSKAAFVGELYRDNNLIQAITGLEKIVSKGEQATLDLLLEVPTKGSYLLKGKVSFEGKETEYKELTIDVGRARALGGSGQVVKIAIPVSLVLAGVAALLLALRFRRSGGPSRPAGPSSSA